jgi:hypothetical protein
VIARFLPGIFTLKGSENHTCPEMLTLPGTKYQPHGRKSFVIRPLFSIEYFSIIFT